MPPVNPFSPEEERSIAKAYVLANTVPSLLVWLERSPAVRRAADELTEDDLLDLVQEQAQITPRTEVAVGKAYAFAIAVLLKRRRAGSIGSMPVSDDLLRWLKQMWDDATRRHVGTTTTVIHSAQTPTVSSHGGAQIGNVIVDPQGNPLVRVRP